mgnify:CR=1 FL=1|jgi:hypothetical protein|tara:strand:- start:359 stop:862 length:504 start_codon:yes stop_codon:yes gene_type:complete
MSSEKDYWKPKSNLLSTQEVIDDLHLDAATWVYIAAWFSFATILYFLRFAVAAIASLVFSSDLNSLFFYMLLDGPILLLSIYISHGLIFRRTNMRKVFPWTALVFIGGYSQFSDSYILEIIRSAGMGMDLFKAIYFGGFIFFLVFSYKYFSNLSPARYAKKTNTKES